MSTTIDHRVVEMRFDNKHFEQNVSTTLSTLDKLKQSLHLKGASRGLEEVNSAAQRVDLSGIGNSAHAIGLKFSAMYSIADQAFRNITNSAMYYGKKIVSSLTIDPIKTGFKEYETQINATQTILSNTKSKGTTIEDVNSALDELNTYADKTIYNFTEMTKNIGTFTAAGVDLDTSVSAIKGIANLAAISGSNSQQASTAMYQLSQALASGTVKLMDWNSVVNAGMGGQVFQDALKETARIHGIAIDDMIKEEGSFRDTLHREWLTSDILTETLSKFTGDLSAEQLKQIGYTEEQIKKIMELGKDANDAATKVKTFTQLWDTLKESAQSGWTSTWEIIVGDFYEAQELLTKISDVVGGFLTKSAEARNNMLENWKALGGRQALIDGLKAAFEGIISIIKPIGEAFREIFPPITSERLAAICERFRDLAKRLTVSGETADKIKRTFAGVFSVIKIGVNIVKSILRAFGSLFGVAGDLGGGLLTITANLGDFLVKLSDGIESTGIFRDLFGGLANIIKGVIKWFAKLARSFKDSFAFEVMIAGFKALMAIIKRTGETSEELAQIAKQVKDAWVNSGLYKFLTKLWDVVKTIGKAIGEALKGIFDAFTTAFAEGDALSITMLLNSMFSGGVLAVIIGLVKKVKDLLNGPGSIMESVSGVLDSVSNRINAFADSIKAESLKTIAVAVAILAASLIALTFVDAKKIEDSLGILTILLGEVIGALIIFSKFAGDASVSITKNGLAKNGGVGQALSAIIGICIGLLAVAKVVKMLGAMKPEEMKQGLLGVTILLAEMITVEILLGKFATNSKGVSKGIKLMKSMAIGLLMLCAPVAILGVMPTEMWSQGLKGVAILLGAFVVVAAALSGLSKVAKMSSIVGGTTSMLIIATGLLMACVPIAVLGAMPFEMWSQGLSGAASIVAMMLIVATALTLMAKRIKMRSIIAGTTSMVLMAQSLILACVPIAVLGILPVGIWLQGLSGVVSVIAAMLIVATALTLMAKRIKLSELIKGAFAMILMAQSLILACVPIAILGALPTQMWLNGLSGLASVLVVLAGVMVLMNYFANGGSKLILAATSMVIVAAAINLLVPALIALGLVPGILLAKSLIALGVGLAIIVGVLKGAAPAAAAALGLAGAFALIAVGAVAFASALLIAGHGLSAIAVGITALSGALIALGGSIDIIAVGLTATVAAIISGVILGIGAGIVALCDVIIEAAPKILEAITVLIVALCDAILTCAPKIVETVLVLVVDILDALVKYIPSIVEKIVLLVAGVIDGLAAALPDLMKSLANLLFGLIQGAIEALGGMDSGPLLDALKNMSMLTLIMVELAAITLLAPAAMLGVFALAGVVAELSIVLDALGNLYNEERISSIENAGVLMEKIGNAVGKFIGGIVGGIAEGVTSSLPAIGEDLSNFMEKVSGFIDGARNVDDSVINGVKNLVEAVLLVTGASFLNDIMNTLTSGFFGPDGIDKFNDGIIRLGLGLAGFSMVTSSINTGTVTAAAEAITSLVTATNAIPNTGGLWGLIAGDNSIAAYGAELAMLGAGILGFSLATNGVNAETVKPAAEALSALVTATNQIPDTGGLIGLITGENSIASYGAELTALGLGIAGFALVTSAIDPTKVTAAAKAAESIAIMTQSIPNSGGVVSWFAGDNSMAAFAHNLPVLGAGLAGFGNAVAGVDPAKITAASNAAKSLAEMTNIIPNQGGVVSWFAGDNSVAAFADNLPLLGTAISGFSTNLGEIVPENVRAAAEAGKALAEMTATIPNQGGVASWFGGDSGLVIFADNLPKVGKAIKSFSTETEGITVDTVSSAADAAKKLAEMTATIPNEGGVKSWFSGDSGMAIFADNIPKVGKAIKSFSTETEGITAETVTAAAEAAKALAEMTKTIPNEGGIKAWFSGDSGVSTFAENIPKVGKAITSFSNETKGINPENVSAAAGAAKDLAEMTKTVPGDSEKIVSFGDNLTSFAGKLESYFSTTSGITEDKVSASKAALAAVKEAAKVESGNMSKTADAIKKLADAMKELANIPGDSANKFKKALGELGKVSGEALVKALQAIKEDTKKAGEAALQAFINGAKGKNDSAKTAFKNIAKACATALKDPYDNFYSAGSYLVDGFAAGISENDYKAEAKARAMAKAAAKAAEEELKINSPSKVFRAIGYSVPEGFALGIDKYGSLVKNSSVTMSKTAIDTVRDSIAGISSIIDSDMDVQPTIRPVVDLSDVRASAKNIGNILDTDAMIGINTNVGAINTMMNRRIQNGVNDDVVSAIDKLRKDFNGADRSIYNINGITYDDGSAVANAISTIVRAVKIDRRT